MHPRDSCSGHAFVKPQQLLLHPPLQRCIPVHVTGGAIGKVTRQFPRHSSCMASHLKGRLCWQSCAREPGLLTVDTASARARLPSPNAAMLQVTVCQVGLIEAAQAVHMCQAVLQRSRHEAQLIQGRSVWLCCWSSAGLGLPEMENVEGESKHAASREVAF